MMDGTGTVCIAKVPPEKATWQVVVCLAACITKLL